MRHAKPQGRPEWAAARRRHFGLTDQSDRSLPRRRTRQRTEPGHTPSLGVGRTKPERCIPQAENRGAPGQAQLFVGVSLTHVSQSYGSSSNSGFVEYLSFSHLLFPITSGSSSNSPLYYHHANITLPLCLHSVGCRYAYPLLCWPYIRSCSATQNAQRSACAPYF